MKELRHLGEGQDIVTRPFHAGVSAFNALEFRVTVTVRLRCGYVVTVTGGYGYGDSAFNP